MAFTFASFNLSAQKVGHLDSSKLLEGLPEYTQANEQITSLRSNLEGQYNSKVTSIQTKVQDLEKKYAEGTITPMALEQERQALAAEEQGIAQFETTAQQQVMNKQNELLTPILDKVQNAIKTFAEEEGYSYIFDSTLGGPLLFTLPSVDVYDQIKSRL